MGITDEAAQIRSIEEALMRRFSGQLPSETICSEVQQARKRFEAANIRTFVPVLVQRAVSERLRGSAAEASAVPRPAGRVA